MSDFDWETYDGLWEPLNDRVERRQAAADAILAQLRADQALPVTRVTIELQNLNETKLILSKAALRGIDRSEFDRIVNRLWSCMQFLHKNSHHFATPTKAEIEQITSHGPMPESPQERVAQYERTLILILLSRPTGRAFWDLTRTFVQALDGDMKTASGRTKRELTLIRQTIRTIAPDWIFKDNTPYASISRYGNRTTQIRGVFSAGLPGLGKRD